jgi:hypothetical protein
MHDDTQQHVASSHLVWLIGALDNGTAMPLAAIIVCTTGLAAGLFWSASRRMFDCEGG